MTHHTPQGLPPLPTPDSFLFQHEETGNTQFVDGQQVEWGFEKNNPRLQKIGGAYTESQMQAYARAALQASCQPQPQQGGGENTARAFIEWCKAQPEDRVPVSIDEALNEFEAALATKEPK